MSRLSKPKAPIVYESVSIPNGDKETIAEIEHEFEGAAHAGGRYQLELVSANRTLRIPPQISQILYQILHQLSQNETVGLVPLSRELSTFEAASILGVSRPYLIRLLDKGLIPHTRTGTHRRINVRDLLAFKHMRDRQRAQALDELAQMNAEFIIANAD